MNATQSKPQPPALHSGQGHESHDHDAIPADLPKVSTTTVAIILTVVVAGLVGLFLLGYLPYRARVARLDRDRDQMQDERPLVQVSVVKRAPTATDLFLPADARANQTTAIIPRANGYLKTLLVDIGDTVKKDQLLAEIDTPEIDAQLLQAKATVLQSEANRERAQNDFDLAKSTLERYENFAKTGGVTQQQLDEKKSAFTQADAALKAGNATVVAGQAEVKRLEALSSWQKVTAPFAGKITARNFDVGALLSPTNTGGKELLRVEQVDVLRVYASVPQQYASFVTLGQKAEFLAREHPGKTFPGTVSRTAGAIDPQTRTLRVEIEVKNPSGVLYAGMYGQAKFTVTQKNPPVRVPSSALVYNAKGTRVAVVNDGKVYFRTIQPGRDFGQEIEVASGVETGDWVVSNPGERLMDGLDVRVAGGPDKATSASADGTPRSAPPAGDTTKPTGAVVIPVSADPKPEALAR